MENLKKKKKWAWITLILILLSILTFSILLKSEKIESFFFASKKSSLNLEKIWVNSTGADQNKDYLTTDLVAYWNFNEGTGTAVTDVFSGQFNGTIYNTVNWMTGIIGNGLNFSLTPNGYINITNQLVFCRYCNFSLSFWVYRKAESSDISIISQQPTSKGLTLFFYERGDLNFYLRGTSDAIHVYPTDYTTSTIKNQWYHFVVTYNGTSTTAGIGMYINGTMVALDRDGSLSSESIYSPPTQIGTVDSGITTSADMFLDEFGIWNRSLNSSEVNDLYNNHLGITFIPVTLDTTPPNINIIYPENTSYTINISEIKYTYSDENPNECWYSTNNGITNSSKVSVWANFTGITSTEGSNTWTLYCDDVAGNQNSSSVTFNKDTIYPMFSDYWDNNGTLTNYGEGLFSVNVLNTNGTVLLEINNTNITANHIIISASINYTGINFSVTPPSTLTRAIKVVNDKLYIGDSTNDKVWEFYLNGTYSNNYSVALESPVIVGITYYNDFFYILDISLKSVFKYYPNWTYTGESFDVYIPTGELYPNGIDIENDYLYLAGAGFNRVWEFYLNGTLTGFNFSLSKSPYPLSMEYIQDYFYITVEDIDEFVYMYSKNGTYIDKYDISEAGTNKIIAYNNDVLFVGDITGNIFLYNFSSPSTTNITLLNVYNASYDFTSAGEYAYRWHSWGNGILNNYNVSEERSYTITEDISPPILTFISQIPPDIDTFNIFSQYLNITYNIVDETELNQSTVKLYYKTNSTDSDLFYYINGTSYSGYQTDHEIITNDSSNYTFSLTDKNVYPASYNIDPFQMRDTVHSTYDLDANNEYIKIRLFNVSNTKNYSLFEIYALNQTALSSSLRIYYCNSTYSTGNPFTEINCVNFYNLPASAPLNHSHSANSMHHVIYIPIDATTNMIENIYVTETSYFLVRGRAGDNAWNVYYIPNVSREDTIQITTDGGDSWENFEGTIDAHIHQYEGFETFSYYACANDTFNNRNCSSIEYDLIGLANLPPIPPIVYSPTESVYAGEIDINYTASYSPNNYEISFYNISLVYEDEIYFSSIKTNNGLNLSYVWNSMGTPNGNYKIRVEACDVLDQCSFGFSEIFSLNNLYIIEGNISLILNLVSYPYVDLNTSYPMELVLLFNNQRKKLTEINLSGTFKMDLKVSEENITYFNFEWNSINKSYFLTLNFLEEGNYPFVIHSQYYFQQIGNITGIFLVRSPYYVTFCGYEQESGEAYINDFAYLIAEFTSSKQYYDENLEQFLVPLGFATTFKTPVFHTLYRDGCGTLKLYEPNSEYAVRLFDGEATFQTTFSPPNITETYGTNIYFGKYKMEGVDYSYRILLSEKDINQYFWLFNWIFIILLVLIIVSSIFLFFVVPQMPSLSLIMGVGGTFMLVVLRIVIWFYWG